MGDVAESMINGEACEVCGIPMGDGHGFPVMCADCEDATVPKTKGKCCETTKKNKPCPINADRSRGGKLYCHVHDPAGVCQINMKKQLQPAPKNKAYLDGGLSAEMSLREYAAITLRVPDSDCKWLDEMIRQSNRDRLFVGIVVANQSLQDTRDWIENRDVPFPEWRRKICNDDAVFCGIATEEMAKTRGGSF